MDFLEKGDSVNALHSFHALRGRGVLPRIETYRSLMIHFYKNGQKTDLINAASELQKSGFMIDVFTCSLILDVFSKDGLVEGTKKAFQDLYVTSEGKINRFALDSLMNCYALRERWGHVIPLLHAYQMYGWEADPEIVEKAKKATLLKAATIYSEGPQEAKDLLYNDPETFFQNVVEDGAGEWLAFKDTLDELITQTLEEGSHPSLFRGLEGIGYEDEVSTEKV